MDGCVEGWEPGPLVLVLVLIEKAASQMPDSYGLGGRTTRYLALCFCQAGMRWCCV